MVSKMNRKKRINVEWNSSVRVLYGAICFLMFVVSGCSKIGGQNHQAERQAEESQASSKSLADTDEFAIDVVEFVEDSGIEPTFPQLWIFDGKKGSLTSTERSYIFGQPLNIEAGKPGPVFSEVEKLEKYLTKNAVSFNRWSKCGAEYCVIRIMPDASLLANCEPCEMMQSRLDEYFSSRGAMVVYRTVLLTNKIPPEERMKNQ